MVSAQDFRNEDPQQLYPPEATSQLWLRSFEIGGPFCVPSRANITAKMLLHEDDDDATDAEADDDEDDLKGSTTRLQRGQFPYLIYCFVTCLPQEASPGRRLLERVA